MTERIAWIDWVKCFGIALVVYAHMPTAKLTGIVFLFHMPLFFMVSGLLYKPRTFKEEFMRSLLYLFVPYLVYNGLLLIVFPPDEGLLKSIVYIFSGNQALLPGNYRPMWFIVSIIFMRLLSCIFKKRMVPVSIILFCIALLLKKLNIFRYESDYFQLQSTMLCYHYFVFGYYYKQISQKVGEVGSMFRCSKIIEYLVILISVLVLLVIGYYFVGRISLMRGDTGESVVLMLLVSYGVSYLFLKFFEMTFMRKSKIIEVISKGTLLILCTHMPILSLFRYFGLPGDDTIFMPVLITLIIMIISYPMIWFCDRYIPILIGKKRV